MVKKKNQTTEKEMPPVKDADAILRNTNFSEESVETSLRTIYEAEKGEMPDMTKFEQIKSKRWIWLLAGLFGGLLVLVLAAWAGFAFFKTFQGFDGKGLDLEVEGPEKIALGQEITYFINYRNPLQEPLASVDLRINFPTDFVITDIKPLPSEQGNVWKLGALAAEERGTIKVRGTFTGALGSVSAVQAIATYRPANYSSNFEAMATKRIEYSETVIEGFVQVPEKAVPGDNVSLIYHIKNTGTETLPNLLVQMTLPEGFAPNLEEATTTSLQGRVVERYMGDLDAGMQTEFILVGTFASGFGGDAVVMAQVGNKNADNRFLPMHKAEAIIPVLAGDLSLNFIVNGSEQKQRAISYGDELMGIIGYENMADEALSDVVVKIKLETIDMETGEVLPNLQLVEMQRIASSASNTVSGAEIIWDKNNVKDLESLSSRANGSIDIGLPIVKTAPHKGAVALRVNVSVDIRAVGDSELNRTITMSPMTFVLLSDATLSAEARYYSEEGAPLGSGPLPPKVGSATAYRIIWKLNKTVHSLKDVEVVATLPRSVSFKEISTSTAGEIKFTEEDRTLHWTLNRMPTDVGEAEVQFNIVLTPVAADDGRFATLMENITFQAADEDIKESILSVIKQLNTDLQSDEGAAGKGVVIK